MTWINHLAKAGLRRSATYAVPRTQCSTLGLRGVNSRLFLECGGVGAAALFHTSRFALARPPPLKGYRGDSGIRKSNNESKVEPEEEEVEVVEWPPKEYRRRNNTFLVVTILLAVGGYIWMMGLTDGIVDATLGPRYRAPTRRKFDQAINALKNLGLNEIIKTDKESLALHTSSPWTPKTAVAQPGAVFYPRDVNDVQMLLQVASSFGIPVIAASGGTSIENQTTSPRFVNQMGKRPENSATAEEDPYAPESWPVGLTIIVDFSEHMNKIIRVDADDMDLVVQPGISYSEINEQLAAQGYNMFFPVDPGPGAMIGGMIGTGCSGTNAVRYGTMRENVISLTAVLPNGEIVKTRSRARKSSAGPDLTKLFIGSEGTLGLVVEATIKLQPIIPTVVGFASFDTLTDAASTIRDSIEKGIRLVCAEIVNDNTAKIIQENGSGTAAKLLPKPSILFKFGGTKEQIKSDIEACNKLVAKNHGQKFVMCKNEEDSDNLWGLRKNILTLSIDAENAKHYHTSDVCVPLSHLPELIDYVSKEIEKVGLTPLIVGHAGDGNLHAFVTYPDDSYEPKVTETISKFVKKAISLDGTCTGEHGIGLSKRQYLEPELGPGTVDLLVSIKKLVDPKLIMNPGKLYPMEKLPDLAKEISFDS